MTKDEALKLALEALESSRVFVTTREKIKHPEGAEWYDQIITAIKEALVNDALEKMAENARELGLDYDVKSDHRLMAMPAQQEPVAWMDEFGNVFPLGAQRGPKYLNEPMKPLYTSPPAQRTWVGLTKEEKQDWIDAMPHPPQPRHFMVLVNAIESELKEKNT